jgi:cytochrome c-type biogenesis protein CcmH/NrfF
VTAQNILLLLWAVVPPIAVLVGAWFFLRAGRRHDERSDRR